MAQYPQTLTSLFLLFDLILFTVLMLRTVTNMYARGARSLLATMIVLIFMIMFRAAAFFTTSPVSHQFLYVFELFFFMLLPLTWVLMTYELSGTDMKKAWMIAVPMFVVNFLFFGYLQSLRTSDSPAFFFQSCVTTVAFTDCEGVFNPLVFVFYGLILLEILGSVTYLVWFYFRYPNTKDRSQFLIITLSIVAIPVVTGLVVLVLGPDVINPIHVAMTVMAIALFFAVYNYKALTFIGEDANTANLIDDVLIVVDNHHIIQDFNLSTLKVFGKQVSDLVNVKLEHAFINFPQLTELFHRDGAAEKVEFMVDGVRHEFEPQIINVLDPDSNEPVGKRLQLRDITKRVDEDTTSISRDRLTNQDTRETFYGLGRKIFDNAKRMAQPVALVVLDIDDFQNINSRYTYVVGDEALVQLVEVIYRVIRNTDVLARFDSDNFVLLLNRTHENAAYQICTRIKEAVATNIFEYEGQEFQFTVSQGYTVYEGGSEITLEGLYETARAALMTSRGEGRNRVAYRELRRF